MNDVDAERMLTNPFIRESNLRRFKQMDFAATKNICLNRNPDFAATGQKKLLDKCKKILAHGINVIINRQLIYDRQERFFSDHGVLTIEQVDFEGIEKLALITGGEIASTFDEPSRIKLGQCKIIEEIAIGNDKCIRFDGYIDLENIGSEEE